MSKLFYLILPFTLVGCMKSPFFSVCNKDCDQLSVRQNRSWSASTLSQINESLSGKMESSLLGNHRAISTNPRSKEIILSLPAPNAFLNTTKFVNELPGVRVAARSDERGESFVDLYYPMYLLAENFDNFSFKKGLPNGENLPGIPGGQLNVINVELDKDYSCHIYFGEGMVAMLLNVPYDPMIKASVPVKKKLGIKNSEDILGFVNTVPSSSQTSGALMISMIVPDKTLKLIKQE